MEKLKTIEEIESEIKDERFLALFKAFVKALESKDYSICKKLAILRSIIGKFEKIHFDYGIRIAYKLVLNVLNYRDYFYWEKLTINRFINHNTIRK